MIRIAIYGDGNEVGACIRELIAGREDQYEIRICADQNDLLENAFLNDIIFIKAESEAGEESRSGVELAADIRRKGEAEKRKQPILIFTAESLEYALNAFDVEAFHYMMKPFSKEKFERVLYKAEGKVRRGVQMTPHLIIRVENSSYKIPADKIYYIESDNRKVRVVTDTESYSYYARLSDLEEELRDSFFRIHKGYLVNLEYIQEFNKTEVTLLSGEHLLISKYKYQDFVKAYLGYIKERRSGRI